ncbi:hypothetical protein BIFANG_03421, partial [Bifidobacterium angulatum DSM 20098 = JCM 7096]
MSQIRIVSINREKDRFLVCPFVMSWGINRVTDRFFRSLKGPGVTAGDVGVALLDSFAFIERTGPLELSLEEQENFWRHDTRYRTYRAFVRNNDLVEVTNYKDKEYWVYAYPPRIGDDWDDEVWRGTVPAGASAEELGQAVLDAYATIDEWKKAHDGRGASGTPDRVQDHWTGGKEKDMGVMTVSVNREGNRILFLPCVECWGMDRATDRFFRSLRGPDVTAGDIGGALLDAFAFIERTGPLELSLEEQENCWRHDTKYKTYRSFARNNDFLQVSVERGKPYFVCAYPPRTSDLVDDEVWRGTVPAGASAEELGQAVLDAYAAIDEWKKAHGRRAGGREPVARSVALCDGGEVLLPGPGEGFAERTSAAGEVLLAFERAGRLEPKGL